MSIVESSRVSGNEEEGEGISLRSMQRIERVSWWLLSGGGCGGGCCGGGGMLLLLRLLLLPAVESVSSMIIGEKKVSELRTS